MSMLSAVCFLSMLRSLLMIAVRTNDNSLDTGVTVLHMAAAACESAKVLKFLRAGASVDDEDWHGRTALHYAAQYCCFQTYNLLVQNGASEHALDGNGTTPQETINDCF